MPIFEAGVFHRLATAGSFKSGPFYLHSFRLAAIDQDVRKEFSIFHLSINFNLQIWRGLTK